MGDPSRAILLVEDDKNDAFFLQYAFESAGIPNPLICVEDGQKTMDYLAGMGPYADRARFPFPCLVLLDLKLPGKGGLEVLRWIQSRPELASLVVVVLTSSSEASDVNEAYRLGARSYLVKPLTVEKRLLMAKAFKDYWLEFNEFPYHSLEHPAELAQPTTAAPQAPAPAPPP
jgi:CheY-like chemotaxis protein